MDYWAKAPIDRNQIALFSPTLDSWIPEDHPIRLFDEILSHLDWFSWESHYDGCVGQPPIHPRILADYAYGTGENLKALEDRAMEAYIPPQNSTPEREPPTPRTDLTKPIPPTAWAQLPRIPQWKNKLDRSAFVYPASEDCYYCPMGRPLTYVGDSQNKRTFRRVRVRKYLCPSCAPCALAGECLIGNAKQRSITHNEFEPARQTMRKRLNTAVGKEIYSRRQWICETPFALIKGYLKFRQFLVRGLAKVKTEWLWVCTSFNLSKLVREITRMRRKFRAMVG